MESSLIGKFYLPTDNSGCINIFTREPACIVQNDFFGDFWDDSYNGPDKLEDGARFEIVSEAYKDDYHSFRDWLFVNVKSSNTGNIYRALYSTKNVRGRF